MVSIGSLHIRNFAGRFNCSCVRENYSHEHDQVESKSFNIYLKCLAKEKFGNEKFFWKVTHFYV